MKQSTLTKIVFLSLFLLTILLLTILGVALHSEVVTAEQEAQPYQPKDGIIKIYGAGGPHLALLEIGKIFTQKTGVPVEIIYGPETNWFDKAQSNADILWGTAEQSMTAFLEEFKEFDSKNVEPIYLTRSVIVVQKGNPKSIESFEDLLTPGVKIVVTEGAGVANTSGTGLWEDVAGRLGSLEDVKAFRKNIIAFTKGSGAGFQSFKDMSADAWLTWVNWPINHPNDADWIEISSDRVIYRDLNVVTNDKADPAAKEFIKFLADEEAEEIFRAQGWFR